MFYVWTSIIKKENNQWNVAKFYPIDTKCYVVNKIGNLMICKWLCLVTRESTFQWIAAMETHEISFQCSTWFRENHLF